MFTNASRVGLIRRSAAAVSPKSCKQPRLRIECGEGEVGGRDLDAILLRAIEQLSSSSRVSSREGCFCASEG